MIRNLNLRAPLNAQIFFFSANVRKSKANELANPTEANIVFENTDKGTIKCSFLKYIRESLTSRELQN